MKRINFAVIGLGARGNRLLHDVLLKNERASVVAVCDKYDDRIKSGRNE